MYECLADCMVSEVRPVQCDATLIFFMHRMTFLRANERYLVSAVGNTTIFGVRRRQCESLLKHIDYFVSDIPSND